MGEVVFVCLTWKEDSLIVNCVLSSEGAAAWWKHRQPKHLCPEVKKVPLNKNNEQGW